MRQLKSGRNAWGALMISLLVSVGGFLSTQDANGYTVMTTSTGAPAGLEQNMIAATTNQFNAKLFVNPFFPNTYQIFLLGPNPNFNPPVKDQDLLKALVETSTHNYVYGFADGMDYERDVDMGVISNYIVNCSSRSYFTTSTATWNANTCTLALIAAEQSIYNLKLSTPVVIPGL